MITWTIMSVCDIFWQTYYREYRPSTGFFIFPPYLFYVPASRLPWKTVETTISVKKIKQNHENFTGRFWFNISICQNGMVHEGRWVNLLTMVGKLEASTVCIRECTRWVKIIVKHGGSGRPHFRRVAVEDFVLSQVDKPKKAPISMWDFAWNCYSLFKCVQDNSQWSPAQMFQTMSFSAVVWSQPHISSHSLINNLIVCNKSC